VEGAASRTNSGSSSRAKLVAVEASASAEYRHRVDVLAQLSTRWGAE
jgi:hypothetical protein